VAPQDTDLIRVRRALLAVDRKEGLAGLGRDLHARGVELWATPGTRRALQEAGVPARPTEELTGIADWFGGRVKTLHPALLGGILAPDTEKGRRELAERKILPFDLVVVNLYPFEKRWREESAGEVPIEAIDVGGVTLARAAAKNHARVGVVTDPAEYPELVTELEQHDGALTLATRRRWARTAFARVASYDASIASALAGREAVGEFPGEILLRREPLHLRYGENPHQRAERYLAQGPGAGPLAPTPFRVRQGTALSYTNLLDLETALSVAAEFPTPTAAVVKHATPVGVASGKDLTEAIGRALATDPVARYGCGIAVNRPLEVEAVEPMKGVFVDLLSAPEFPAETLARLAKRAKLKAIEATPPDLSRPRWEARSVLGHLLVQEADTRQLAPGDFRLVTSRKATPHEACALDFAWRVVRHARSNAVVLAQGSATVGIGSGQPSRVKAVRDACEIAGDRARGAVLASDAFFPFSDGLEAAADAGVVAIIQPGGSMRDAEIVATAEKRGISLYMTGWRVFRH
jgi:phosphoribosylaminoimidazolecarboxamide formyltransferase / IMP cyclohydrolase